MGRIERNRTAVAESASRSQRRVSAGRASPDLQQLPRVDVAAQCGRGSQQQEGRPVRRAGGDSQVHVCHRRCARDRSAVVVEVDRRQRHHSVDVQRPGVLVEYLGRTADCQRFVGGDVEIAVVGVLPGGFREKGVCVYVHLAVVGQVCGNGARARASQRFVHRDHTGSGVGQRPAGYYELGPVARVGRIHRNRTAVVKSVVSSQCRVTGDAAALDQHRPGLRESAGAYP